jgi:putative addiction module killer protein
MKIVHYVSRDGIDLYQEWLESLRDNRVKVAILRRIDRASLGNFGDHKACRDGVSEMRIDQGPGYRVYYFQHGQALVVLLCGGDKSAQNADIDKAVTCRADFLRRLPNDEENEEGEQ